MNNQHPTAKKPSNLPSVEVRIDEARGMVQKIAHDESGHQRVVREGLLLAHLTDVDGVPKLLSAPDSSKIEMQLMVGESLRQWLGLDAEWRCEPKPLTEVWKRLGQYAALDMRLLQGGVLYRDLNPDHLLWSEQGASIVDFEASSLLTDDGRWRTEGERGTWETMAPEEFIIHSLLSERTATYRMAVLAHLALSGVLPVKRKPTRSQALAWRRKYGARVSLDLPPAAGRVIQHALSVEPSRRHAHPEAFLAALKDAYDRDDML